MSWHERAACRDADPDLFWPVPDEIWEGVTPKFLEEIRIARAKLICAGCPVRAACLAWATANPHDALDGIWGGATLQERRHHARIRAAAESQGQLEMIG